MKRLMLVGLVLVLSFLACAEEEANDAGPRQPIPLIFIHHSCGENWLSDENGGLGKALAGNNYYVSDTNYGWGPEGIGDSTDITNWTEWFCGPNSSRIMAAVYKEKGKNSPYTKLAEEAKGENEIIMFKSCFPNSDLAGSPNDPPGKGEGLSVGNAKAIYNQLLTYFKTRPDKLFIAITAPPLQEKANAKNARAFNQWLVKEWLANYKGSNVAVFDFYNVLTGPDNHHRFQNGKIEHTVNSKSNVLYYPSDDTHPSSAGNRKATKEFLPLLNYYYQRWRKSNPPDTAAVLKSNNNGKTAVAETEKEEETAPVQAINHVAGNMATSPVAGVFDNFETGSLEGWESFPDDGKPGSVVKFSRNTENAASGKAAMEITYNIVPESYVTCAKTYSAAKDWSQAKGISLSVFSEDAGSEIDVVVYQGQKPDDLRLFEYQFSITPANKAKWQNVKIPWKLFRQPDWQGDPAVPLNPKEAMGIAIIHHSGTKRRIGKTLVDDLQLMSE